MDKMKMESANITDMNIEKIAALFPNCITETADENGKLKKAINFEMLRAMLSEDIAEGDEAYEFTWVGKKAAIAEANRPIRKTLRPCPEESVNWDTTENLYIEGDNLEVLKLLQESYLGKVKMIYIDPPYNTGNDFIYRDDFAVSADDYAEESGQLDEDGNRLFKNTDSNGRFHSDWCSMIYSRLMLARNLLSDGGVIFISIDDNEQSNLKEICDEVFGAENFVSNIIWQHSIQPKGYLDTFSVHHNFVLLYQKSDNYHINPLPRTDEDNKAYSNPDNDPNGPWRSGDVRNALYRPNLIYDIISPSGKVIKPCSNGWRWSKETVEEKIRTGEIIFSKDETRIIRKIYLKNLEGRAPETIWFGKDVGTTREGISELKSLFDRAPFDTPKPVGVIKRMMQLVNDNDAIVMDFFSGSATTAHAVMQLNAEDGGHRKFIMVQLPEKTDESSEAYKAGYKNICEIGKERIRRAAKKIQGENDKRKEIICLESEEDISLFTDIAAHGKKAVERTKSAFKTIDESYELDTGFRVLKLDDTNMQDVYYTPAETDQQMLSGFESNIKPDRTDLDLLFGCLLDWGLPLSMPYSSEQIEGVTVHTYNDGDLIACFDKAIHESVIKTIAKRQPLRVVFRDDSFADSPSKINVSEIFKMLSPDTRVKVI